MPSDKMSFFVSFAHLLMEHFFVEGFFVFVFVFVLYQGLNPVALDHQAISSAPAFFLKYISLRSRVLLSHLEPHKGAEGGFELSILLLRLPKSLGAPGLLLSFEGSFYIVDAESLSSMRFANVVSLSVACLVSSSQVFCTEEKFRILMRFHLSIFPFTDSALGSYPRTQPSLRV